MRTRRRRSKNVSGPRIRAARGKTGLTQLKLSRTLKAKGVDLDRAGVAKIETGRRHVLDYELAAFAKALRVPVGRLLGR
jgi:transcriptional regulator with XRE-family HTH domain